MRNGICYLVGAGENYGLDFQSATKDLVIAADAGLRYLREQGIRAGYTCFHIYCGTGGRIDHTMANLQVLGVSAASVAEAVNAAESVADYLGVGAMFPTGAKLDAEYVSMDLATHSNTHKTVSFYWIMPKRNKTDKSEK